MTEQELNLHLKDIINTMNDGLFVTRPDGSLIMANDSLLRMTGYTREELHDKPCTILDCDACKRSRSEGKTHWCRLFNTKKEMRRSCHIRRKDGTYLHVIKNASVLQDEGGRVIGAVETLTDVTDLDQKELKIQKLSRLLDTEQGFMGMVGKSEPMRKLFALLEKAAQSDAPVILFGESGTGKELAAAAIHELGPRTEGPFVQINCAAFNEALLESEIFGHVKGAFTGAYRHRIGRFEEAAGGDVFLDEVGDVPLSTQVKLLRVLETKRFERVGDSRAMELDARVISATNQDLRELVTAKRFREDFYFRINVIPVHIPPLRDRREDIPLLVAHFLKLLCAVSGKSVTGLSPAAMEACTAYDWPGNVRELKSALEYGLVLTDHGPLDLEHLPQQVAGASVCGPDATTPAAPKKGKEEKRALVDALRESGGNKSETARRLGVTRVTVLNRMRKYGIDLKTIITG